MDKKKIITHIILVVVIVGVAFAGGLFYGKSMLKGKNRNTDMFAQNAKWSGGVPGGQKAGNRMAGGGLSTGEILSKDDQSIVVKMRDGGSKIVLYTTSTKIMKSTIGVIDDIKVGDSVVVVGKTNTDGSVNAESIQIQSPELMPAQPAKPEQKQ